MRPMRRRVPLPLLLSCPLIVGLAACHAEVKGDNGSTASISIGNDVDHDGAGGNGQSVSINVPGFSGKMTVPGLNIGDDAKIDDMPFFPGTRVTGINVTGESGDGSGGHGKGHVDMAFTAPGDSAALVGWYRDQAQQHGWTVVPPTGANQFEATKDKADGTSRFAVQMAPQGTGSAGHFLVSGS